jgi:transcriptional regulator with PAS, ATPase and Fis domain
MKGQGTIVPVPGETPQKRRLPSGTCKSVIVGESPAFAAVRAAAAVVANRACTVMILGETGSGKEVVARYLHTESDRCQAPFVPVDCSALSDTLFESELFGHVRGAFTGATRESLGFIRAADGGTLFLDEIGELSPALQAKLLRVIQERAVVPVGDTRPRAVNIRLIAATNRDLAEMVRQGSFRQDLFFRLNVLVLRVPPLRERLDDVVMLAEHFLRLQSQLYDEPLRRLSPRAQEMLVHYAWPGNVRELANAMEQAHVLARGETIEPNDLPVAVQSSQAGREPPVSDLFLRDIERRAIVEALRRTHHCKAAASRLLGLNVQRLNRRMASLRIS